MAVGKFVNVKMWFGVLDEEPEKDTEKNIISESDIDYFELTENMFTELPSLFISLSDNGAMAKTRTIKPGDTIAIKITVLDYSSEDSGDLAEPLVAAEYAIQTITKGLSDSSNISTLKLYCVYNAATYLNQIVTYPEDNYLTKVAYQKTKSTDVMNEVLLGTSIGFICEKESNDASFWLSCNETRAKFIERLTERAWVGPDDAPITYVDRNGILHFNTIRNMISMPIGLSCAFPSPVLEEVEDAANEVEAAKNVNTVLITDAQHINAALPILNQGGYTLQYSMYDPYNGKNLDFMEFPKWGLGAAGEVLESLEGSEDPGDGFRSTEGHSEEKFLAGIPNKTSNEFVSDNVDAGMAFDECHVHYNIAPKYNETMRRSFFQTFVTFTVDTSKQGTFFGTTDNMFRLGQIVNCNFSNNRGPDAIHSGKYAVCKIKHIYQAGMPYQLEVTVVNDGYYGA